MGGPHATSAGPAILFYHPEIDLVFHGEAEDTILEVLERKEKGLSLEGIAGTYWRVDNDTVGLIKRPLIRDLDKIPFPARDLLNMGNYSMPQFPGKKAGTLITSRGCHEQCVYCSSSETWGRQFRFRGVGNVLQELDILKEEGYEALHFEDDIFTANMKRAKSLCDEMSVRDYDFDWSCETRADYLDEELIKAMAQSGCKIIYFGVESGSQRILDAARKRLTKEQLVGIFRLVEKYDIKPHASVQFGLPGEDKKTIDETIQWLNEELKPASLELHLATLYPSTPLSNMYYLKGEHWEPNAFYYYSQRMMSLGKEGCSNGDINFLELHRKTNGVLWESMWFKPSKIFVHGTGARLLSPYINQRLVKCIWKKVNESRQLIYESGFSSSFKK